MLHARGAVKSSMQESLVHSCAAATIESTHCAHFSVATLGSTELTPIYDPIPKQHVQTTHLSPAISARKPPIVGPRRLPTSDAACTAGASNDLHC